MWFVAWCHCDGLWAVHWCLSERDARSYMRVAESRVILGDVILGKECEL